MSSVSCARCGREMRKKARYCPHCGVPVAARPGLPAPRTNTSAPEGVAAVESPRADSPSRRRTAAAREARGVSPHKGLPEGLPDGLPERPPEGQPEGRPDGPEVAPPFAGPDLAGPGLAVQSGPAVWSPAPADVARIDPFRPAPVSLAALILLAAGLVFLLAWLAIG